jgi:alginate O-acetyltransferase complex protein AlgI
MKGGIDMLFASAGFLFAFFPLFMLMFAIVPDRAKKVAVLIGSVAFYVLANIYNPFSILFLWLAVLLHYFAALLLRRFHDRFLLILLITVDIMALFSLRLLCNQLLEQYYFTFPVGASIYFLMGISYLIDCYRNPAPQADDLMKTAMYLSFFPVLLAGPLIRFHDFREYAEHFSFRMDNFARGARVMTLGLVKCMGVGAVLAEAYDNILLYSEMQVNVTIGILSLAMMYLIVFFFFSGYSDMGAGICIMLGMPVDRDYRYPLTATSPMAYLKGFFHSFYEFFKVYVTDPLERCKFGSPYLRRVIGLVIYVLSLTLWFRVSPNVLWVACPLLLAVLVESIPPVSRFFRCRFGKICGWLLTFISTVVYWAMFEWGSYDEFRTYLGTLLEVSGSYQSLYTYATSIGSDFIIVGVIALVILMPLSSRRDPVGEHISAKVRPLVEVLVSLLLIVLLVLTLVYFLPQFPQYATAPYAYFVI